MKAKETTIDLLQAVKNLYYSACWTADRPVPEHLWADLRDAAGFAPGQSPKRMPFEGIQFEYSVPNLRLLGASIRSGFTSEQARAFLTVHNEQLQAVLTETLRDFLTKKLK